MENGKNIFAALMEMPIQEHVTFWQEVSKQLELRLVSEGHIEASKVVNLAN